MPLYSLYERHKSILLSALIHFFLAFFLWFSSRDFVAPEPIKPRIIEATILPAPKLPTPKIELENKKNQNIVKQKKAPKTPAIKSARPPKVKVAPINRQPEATKENSTLATNPNNIENIDRDEKKAQTPQSSIPIETHIQEAGFTIQYDVHATYKSTEADGGATFIFNRTGNTYQATLKSKASIAKFSATSEGEVRSNTIATTRFKDGRTISFLGIGKERAGSQLNVDYTTQQVAFSGSGGAQPLAHDVVYDYLSAMVYIQALLQNKKGQVSSLSLPIAKRNHIATATVVFGASERLSTAEGVFQAIPATIVIPSGSIQSIRMWFVPDKKYRPLQIELAFNKGKALLISRDSD